MLGIDSRFCIVVDFVLFLLIEQQVIVVHTDIIVGDILRDNIHMLASIQCDCLMMMMIMMI
jgi:hypothetical protein